MYGVIDTVQVVSQRVRHANEANAGAKVSRIDPEIMRANKTLVNGILPRGQSLADSGKLERD